MYIWLKFSLAELYIKNVFGWFLHQPENLTPALMMTNIRYAGQLLGDYLETSWRLFGNFLRLFGVPHLVSPPTTNTKDPRCYMHL